jgi:HEAT repeat protein
MTMNTLCVRMPCAALLLWCAATAPIGAQAGARPTPPADEAGAARLQIASLLDAQKFDQALSTYDEYVKAAGKTDARALALIARADLRRGLAQHAGDPLFVSAALERLAASGDQDALQAIKRAAASSSGTSEEALAPLAALARLGDADAEARLGRLLDSAAADDKTRMIRVLQDAGARSQAPKIAALLGDPQSQVRGAAALAAGALQFSAAVPRLQELFSTDLPVVRMFAAAGLKRLGQSSADAYLSDLLRNGAPEVRLIAAEAYQSGTTSQWAPSIKELLSDRNEINRVRAAELLACCDPPAARSALLDALASGNPSMREEAARVLEARGLTDARVARRLLGDASDAVRLHGAGAALRASTTDASGRSPR